MKNLNNRGISLLEVLISMLVMAIGVMGLAPLIVLSVNGNNMSRDASLAAGLAKEKIEYFEGLTTLPAVPYTEIESNVDGYQRTTVIKDISVDSLIPAGVYQIAVDIVWTDKAGKDRNSNFTGLIAKN